MEKLYVYISTEHSSKKKMWDTLSVKGSYIIENTHINSSSFNLLSLPFLIQKHTTKAILDK